MNEQDQRRTSDMEDSTSMTIEFLRARLLSERSVSRTARQRADELAARVAELEEQMKIVSLQRKKAEKATADVLAILENHGITDVSDGFDSSSDQEGVPHESKVGNYFKKDEELSISSKARSDDVENISGSDCESCPLPGRSLSWKSSKSNSSSLEKKHTDSPSRRRSCFSSTGSSSSKNRQGKSCRKIRRREIRPAVDDKRNEGAVLSSEPSGAVSSSVSVSVPLETAPKHLSVNGEEREDKVTEEVTESLTTGYQFSRELDGDRDMEKALEHQAELIGRFEAEEKAQREWEEKFREIKSNSPLERGLHGLEPVVVANFPTKKYSDEFFKEADDSQCTVCLAEYHEEDILRILPYCGHAFHVTCIDIWLHQHSTCPVCRISLREISEKKRLMQPMFSSAVRYNNGMESLRTHSYHCLLNGHGYSSRTLNNRGMAPIQEDRFASENNAPEAGRGISPLAGNNQVSKDASNNRAESPSNA